jgi:hypothetical protein
MCSSRFIISVILLSLPSFCGCVPRPTSLPTRPTPDVSRILSSLEAQGKGLTSFRGAGRLKAARNSGVKSFRAIWIGSKPQNIRVETLGPWGQPYLTLVVNGQTFTLYSHQENRCVTGEATKRNLLRFASVPFRPEDLFTLLSGRPPILPYHQAKIHASAAEGGWLIGLYRTWGRLLEKIWLKDDETTVEQIEVFDGWGDLQYRIAFSEFHDVGSYYLAHRIEISDPEGPLWSITVERFWPNIAIPEGAYNLKVCAGEVGDRNS